MQVLVTGHRGRVGQAFFALYGRTLDLRGFDLLEGDDVKDGQAIEAACQGCDAVVHLAALARPQAGFSYTSYFETNVCGTYEVARAAARAGVSRFVHASSMAVYGLERGIPIPERISEQTSPAVQRLAPHEISCTPPELAYHISKVQAELALMWFGLTGVLAVLSLRLGPIDVVHMGLTLPMADACLALYRALLAPGDHTFVPITVAAPAPNLDLSTAARILGYPAGVEAAS